MTVTLWGERSYCSPYVFSAFVGLTEKGVPFSVKTIDVYAGDQHAPEYAAASLTSRVPRLDHDGFSLAESSAIVEYVDEVFDGPPLLPRAAQERARARQVMAWIRSDLLALREERPTSTMFYARASKPLSEAGTAAASKLLAVSDRLISLGATQLFATWSVADADLAFMLHRLILNGHEVPSKIRAYAEVQWNRPSARSFVEHERPERAPT